MIRGNWARVRKSRSYTFEQKRRPGIIVTNSRASHSVRQIGINRMVRRESPGCRPILNPPFILDSIRAGILDKLAQSFREEDRMSFQRRQVLQTLSYAFGFGFILPRNEFAVTAQNPTQPASPDPPAKAAAGHELGGTEM